MHDSSLLSDIGKAILAAAVLGFPAYLLRVPLLLAYLLAGVLLGPQLGFGLVKSPETIATLSEIGLVLLMFILGLEIDLRKLLQAGKAVLVNGVTQFTGCALVAAVFFGVLTSLAGSTGNYGLLYLCVAGSLSSTLIAVKILSDRMELDTLTSRITLGILVLQDLWAIGFLSVQPNLDNLSAGAVGLSLVKAACLVVTSGILARYLLPRVFARAGKQPELMLILAMAWCFGICGFADYLHLSLEMGALVAGISIASFPYHVDVASKISSLRDFFVTLFFVSLGLQIPMPTSAVLTLAGGIVVFALVSRLLTVFPVLHALKYGNRASLLPALNLSQISEFALVLAALGVGYGHVSQDLLSAFILAMVATALLSSMIIPNGHAIYRWANPWLEKIGFKDHVSVTGEDISHAHDAQTVLLGFHREASSLLHEMLNRYSEAALKNVMIVDFNPEAHQKLKALGIACKYADLSHEDTLRHLHLEHAKLFVCTIPDLLLKGTNNLKLARTLKKIAPDARIIVTAESSEGARRMYEEGADFVFLPRIVGAQFLADVMERMQSEGPAIVRAQAELAVQNRTEVIP